MYYIIMFNISLQHNILKKFFSIYFNLTKSKLLSNNIHWNLSFCNMDNEFRKILKPMKIYGHRGASDNFPENTDIAFRKALNSNLVDGVECDLQQLKSGEIIIIHDNTLERTCVNNTCFNLPINKLNYDDIKNLNVGNSEYYQNIMLFEDFIKLVISYNKLCLIEIKNVNVMKIDEILCNLSKNILNLDKFIENNIYWISFNLHKIIELKNLCQKFKVLYIIDSFNNIKSKINIVYQNNLDGIDLCADFNPKSGTFLSKDYINYAKSKNLIVGAWVWKKIVDSDTLKCAIYCKNSKIDFFTSNLKFIK